MELDPTLHTKSMAVQLQTLIVDAFQCLSPPPQHSYLVIIDGLDECRDKATQQEILRLLCETITVHKLPLRFLIGSRPESHIRDSFDRESLYKVTRRVILDETFDPGRDIRVFLQDGFAKICAENSILFDVEHPWPREDDIDLLVQRSSGQFSYAMNVLEFVGADFCSPMEQLALVLKSDSTAFSDLDQFDANYWSFRVWLRSASSPDSVTQVTTPLDPNPSVSFLHHFFSAFVDDLQNQISGSLASFFQNAQISGGIFVSHSRRLHNFSIITSCFI